MKIDNSGAIWSIAHHKTLATEWWAVPTLGRTDIQTMSVISAASQMKPAKFAGFFS